MCRRGSARSLLFFFLEIKSGEICLRTYETKYCSVDTCPVDCQWNAWAAEHNEPSSPQCTEPSGLAGLARLFDILRSRPCHPMATWEVTFFDPGEVVGCGCELHAAEFGQVGQVASATSATVCHSTSPRGSSAFRGADAHAARRKGMGLVQGILSLR